MKIFIAGATGRVAAHVIAGLTAKGHTVVGGSRHPEALERGEGRQGVFLDLHASVEALSAALAGMDAVYFLAGSRGKDLLQTDAFGAVKLAKAAAKGGSGGSSSSAPSSPWSPSGGRRSPPWRGSPITTSPSSSPTSGWSPNPAWTTPSSSPRS